MPETAPGGARDRLPSRPRQTSQMNNPRYSTETIADSRLAAAQPPWPRPAVLRLLELQPGAPGCYRFIRDVPVDAPAILFCGGIKKWNPEFAEESAEATARLFHSLLLRCDVPPDAVRLIVVTGATPDYPRQRTDERRRYNLSPYTFTGAAGDLAAGLVRSLLDGVDDAARRRACGACSADSAACC